MPDTAGLRLPDTVSGVTDTAIVAIVDELKRQAEASLALIADQAETIGELRAENRALVARTEAQTVEPAPKISPSPWRVWWFWLVLLAPFILTAIVVAVALLTVPR